MSKIMKCVIILSIIAAFASPAAALSPNRETRERLALPGFFEKLAVNGVVVLNQLPEDTPRFVREAFRQADTNRDGKLTQREFNKFRRGR